MNGKNIQGVVQPGYNNMCNNNRALGAWGGPNNSVPIISLDTFCIQKEKATLNITIVGTASNKFYHVGEDVSLVTIMFL